MCNCGVGSVLAVVEELEAVVEELEAVLEESELDEGSFDIDIGVVCSIIQLLTALLAAG
jgi:hypothetical protein